MAEHIHLTRDGIAQLPRSHPSQHNGEPKFKDVTIKVSKIGNGYQVTELATGVPFAYFDLGFDNIKVPPESTPATSVAEHLVRFFAKLEATIG